MKLYVLLTYYCIDMCLQTCCIPTYILLLYVYIVTNTSAAGIACARGLDNMAGK